MTKRAGAASRASNEPLLDRTSPLVNLPRQIEAKEQSAGRIGARLVEKRRVRSSALRNRGARAGREPKRKRVPVELLLNREGERRPMNPELGSVFNRGNYLGDESDRRANVHHHPESQ